MQDGPTTPENISLKPSLPPGRVENLSVPVKQFEEAAKARGIKPLQNVDSFRLNSVVFGGENHQKYDGDGQFTFSTLAHQNMRYQDRILVPHMHYKPETAGTYQRYQDSVIFVDGAGNIEYAPSSKQTLNALKDAHYEEVSSERYPLASHAFVPVDPELQTEFRALQQRGADQIVKEHEAMRKEGFVRVASEKRIKPVTEIDSFELNQVVFNNDGNPITFSTRIYPEPDQLLISTIGYDPKEAGTFKVHNGQMVWVDGEGKINYAIATRKAQNVLIQAGYTQLPDEEFPFAVDIHPQDAKLNEKFRLLRERGFRELEDEKRISEGNPLQLIDDNLVSLIKYFESSDFANTDAITQLPEIRYHLSLARDKISWMQKGIKDKIPEELYPDEDRGEDIKIVSIHKEDDSALVKSLITAFGLGNPEILLEKLDSLAKGNPTKIDHITEQTYIKGVSISFWTDTDGMYDIIINLSPEALRKIAISEEYKPLPKEDLPRNLSIN